MSDIRHKPPKPNILDPNEMVGTSATAHVGKTLESDPEFNDRPERIPDIAGEMTSSGGNDLTANPHIKAGENLLLGMEIDENGNPVESLKTRLPGDTSSDPHTDVGPDNATTMQNLPDVGSHNRKSRKAK